MTEKPKRPAAKKRHRVRAAVTSKPARSVSVKTQARRGKPDAGAGTPDRQALKKERDEALAREAKLLDQLERIQAELKEARLGHNAA